jgi:uncharacterized protein (DUF885 family)
VKLQLPLAALLLATTGIGAAQPGGAPAPAAAQSEDARLTAFLDAAFDEAMALSPQQQTQLGLKTNYDRLDDYTDAERGRELALAERQLAALRRQFDPAHLGVQARLSFRLFEGQVARQRESYRWRWHRFAVTNNGSPMGAIPVFLINNHRIDNVADAEAYVARLNEVERVMGEISANIRHQAELGIVPPRFNFDPVRADGRRILTGAPFDNGPDSALFADFQAKVDRLQIADAEKTRLIEAARIALTGPFRRGYQTLLAALDAIEPRATGNEGAWSLPDGAAYYNAQLRARTTTTLTADQIHAIGLHEVARIQGEMRAIMVRVHFAGTLQQFFHMMMTDPRFRYSNDEAGRQQYLADARADIAAVMAVAPRWFRRLPRAALEVRAVEPWRQATAAVAFYNRPSADGSRPGIMYVNLGDMHNVLRLQVDGTSFHEGAPGHHFQNALAIEMAGLPKFRRFGFYGAYLEGWGLYAEGLAKEMGFYQDPYHDFGRLSLELWRAVRLVVDTGIHARHWTREQSIRYFTDNTLLSEGNVVREVERYFDDPGQATSYMIGQRRILELRARARRALGTRFDIRDFHAVVLENGAVPLDTLAELVDAYIAEKRTHR